MEPINKITNKLNMILSINKYNSNYINLINNFKNNQTSQINGITNTIENINKGLSAYNFINDNNNDICFSFLRKKKYTCTCGAIYYIEYSDLFCLPLNLNINKNEGISTDLNLIKFNNDINSFFSDAKKKIDIYNLKMNNLYSNIAFIEEEIINENIKFTFQNDINLILSQKFEDKIIKKSYEFYQKMS